VSPTNTQANIAVMQEQTKVVYPHHLQSAQASRLQSNISDLFMDGPTYATWS